MAANGLKPTHLTERYAFALLYKNSSKPATSAGATTSACSTEYEARQLVCTPRAIRTSTDCDRDQRAVLADVLLPARQLRQNIEIRFQAAVTELLDALLLWTNIGHALETAVFNELQRRGADVEYVKTADGFEVDFHVRHRAGDRELLQVCADPGSEQTRTREFRALGSAAKENPRLPALLLVLTQEQAAALSAEPFRIVPAYEWMLEQ
jgi:hypothetical protein